MKSVIAFKPAVLTLGTLLLPVAIVAPRCYAQGPLPVQWDVAALNQAPRVTPIAEQGDIRSLYFDGPVRGGRATQVFAYMGIPTGTAPAGGWPGVVLLHGGGGTAYSEWVRLWNEAGFAAIAMDLEGRQPDPADPKKRTPTPVPGVAQAGAFGDSDAPVKDQFTYAAVSQALLAHSLLASQPGVNAQKVGLCGVSYGSIWTYLAAAADNRTAFAIPIYGHGFLDESEANVKISPARRANAIKWDPSAYVPSIKAPLFFLAGANDRSFAPPPWQKTVDRAPAGAQQLLLTNFYHSHEDAWRVPEPYSFASSVVKGQRPITLAPATPRTVTSAVTASQAPASAEFCFTTDSGPFEFRKWQRVPASVTGTAIAAPAIPNAARITASYFLGVFEGGVRRSSPVTFNAAAEVKLEVPAAQGAKPLVEHNFDALNPGPLNGQGGWVAKGVEASVVPMEGRGNSISLAFPYTDATLSLPDTSEKDTVFVRFSIKATPAETNAPDASQKMLIYAEDANGKPVSMTWRNGNGFWGLRINGAYGQKPLAGKAEWTDVEWILDQKNKKVTLRLKIGDNWVTQYATVDYTDLAAGPVAKIRFVRNKEGNPEKCYLDDIAVLATP